VHSDKGRHRPQGLRSSRLEDYHCV